MKRFVLLILGLYVCTLCLGQTTYFNESWTYSSWSHSEATQCGRLSSIEIQETGVVVTIELKALKALKRLSIFSSHNTYIESGELKLLRLSGVMVGNEIKSCGTGSNWGWDNVPVGEIRSYQLFFKGTLPPGITKISVVDHGYNGSKGYCFWNRTINNPRKNYLNFYTEYAVKQHVDQNNNGICGIYETSEEVGYRLACVKSNGEYKLIYVDSKTKIEWWNLGDIKAELEESATVGLFKANWYMGDKSLNSNCYVLFDGSGMSVLLDDTKTFYLKMYPTNREGTNSTIENVPEEWSGTGFAIANGYIVTNSHVVNGAKTISVKGVSGDINTGYSAQIVATDKVNDIAIVKINDPKFKGFGQIPYAVQSRMADVGEDVFVLGYPLTQALGNEIKLTNGIISSRTGYQGDIATYQISAPVQPGNSGGPMFDNKGNVIGIVVAGVLGAENVGYAIKISYLKILIESAGLDIKFPINNIISTLSLAEKVKKIKNFVYYIECSRY